MYLFLTALVAANTANAGDIVLKPPIIVVPPGGCGTRPPPCLGLQDADGEVMPDDWLVMQREVLRGELNYFRIEVYVFEGAIAVDVAGFQLTEQNLAVEESNREVSVYYVPAASADIRVTSTGRDLADFELVISGEQKSGL
ncbi:MAG: hypothetical protein V4850_17915 [Myxococcota bacterium]